MAVVTDQNLPDVMVRETQVSNFIGNARRISWGAIIAGVVMAIVIQNMLNVLGLALGATAIDPSEGADAVGPVFSSAAVIWISVSTLLSIFAGGYVAAHLAGNGDKVDATLHGLLTWAVGTILSVLLVTTTASGIASGVSSLVTDGIALIGASVEDVAPEVADALDAQELLLMNIREEAGAVGVDESATSQNAELVVAVGNLLREEADTAEAEEARAVAVDIMVESTELTQTEAQAQIEEWEAQYRDAVAQADDLAIIASERLADATAATGGILFLILVLGAIAGGAGGFAGRPFDEDEVIVAT